MRKEAFLQDLMQAMDSSESVPIYDYTASQFKGDSEVFASCRAWTNQLVRDKLARYTDPEHTRIELTNYGKFWMIKGGYLRFLEEGHREKENHNHHNKEELVEARLKLTHYRLWGFWLSLLISVIGFLLSLFNLYLILKKGLLD